MIMVLGAMPGVRFGSEPVDVLLEESPVLGSDETTFCSVLTFCNIKHTLGRRFATSNSAER